MVDETVRIQTPAVIDAMLFQSVQDRRKAIVKGQARGRPTKQFYLLKGVIVCGHCGTPMGRRTRKAGHQHVYYCVKKEREWVTRGDDHPNWKRGTGCSIIRSVNIERTDSLVWNMVKDVLGSVRQQTPELIAVEGSDHHGINDDDQVLTDGVSWMSPEQLDLLSDDDKKAVVSKVVTRVSVHFDQQTNKHSVHVEFAETICRVTAQASDGEDSGQPSEDCFGDLPGSAREQSGIHTEKSRRAAG